MAKANPTPFDPSSHVSWRPTNGMRLSWAEALVGRATGEPPTGAIDLGWATLANPEALSATIRPAAGPDADSGNYRWELLAQDLLFHFKIGEKQADKERLKAIAEFWQKNSPGENSLFGAYEGPKAVRVYAQAEIAKYVGGRFVESRIGGGFDCNFYALGCETNWFLNEGEAAKVNYIQLRLAPVGEIAFFKLDGPIVRAPKS